MIHRHAFEAVDRTLRDLMKTVDQSFEEIPFGGKVVVFGGDFRQILPVIMKGTREDIIRASLRRSILWKNIRLMKLKTNMRLLRAADDPDAAEQEEFAKWLLKVGEGRVPNVNKLDDNTIQLPNDIVLSSQNINDLIYFVYPGLSINSNP